MRPLARLAAFLLALGSLLVAEAALAAAAGPGPVPRSVDSQPPVISTASGAVAKATADSFYVYGGPGTLEGSFEGPEAGIPDDQGWFGVDRTLVLPKWKVSDYNASTLNGHGAGNHALWCGVSAEEEPGWVAAPGYGNGWNQEVIFTSDPLTDPSSGQTVALDFYFHHDTEPGYDYFSVQYDSAGTWLDLLNLDGSDAGAGGVFSSPGIQLSQIATGDIVYAGGDYAGDEGDRIRIRLLFRSDGAHSDQDGLWQTDGAVQVDDVSLDWSDGSRFWDMESGWPIGWTTPIDFAGDFARVFPALPDLDPCTYGDPGPLLAFVDEGQDACPDTALFYEPDAICSTGGTTPVTYWGGEAYPWVVNYNGGLSGGEIRLRNEFWSPPIEWNLAGPADDGIDVVAGELRFDAYAHLPLENAIFYTWSIRSHAAGAPWSEWRDRGYVYFGGRTPMRWRRHEVDVTPYLELPPERVQIALGVWDTVDFFPFPGGDATTSPHFDNVALVKWRLDGPRISAEEHFLAQGGFPVGGSIDASTVIARDGLDVPFDMAADAVSDESPPNIDTGDSIVVRAEAVIPGSALEDLRMVWVLDKNPLFEDAIRNAPARPQDVDVDTTDPARWSGAVLGDGVSGTFQPVLDHQFYFDLPDEDFLYPGDVLRYYVRATDDAGRISTLPSDLSGFASGIGYDRRFTVRALPSIQDASGRQPSLLVINGVGHGDGEDEFRTALHQLGRREGAHFDTYTVRAPFELVSNGIGSAGGHGATATQLAGYSSMFYLNGDLLGPTLSDGSHVGWSDESDDLAVLTAWHDLPGPRSMAYFGSNFVGNLGPYPAFETYASGILGLDFVRYDVSYEIGWQRAPVVAPTLPGLGQTFVAFGACPDRREFNQIRPVTPAVAAHGFLDPSGLPYPGVAASVVHERLVAGDRKVDFTFPFSLASITEVRHKAPGSRTALAGVFADVLELFGEPAGGDPTPVPPHAAVAPYLRAHPSPFNPRTTIELSAPPQDALRVEIFDVRGRLVRELHRGPWTEGGTLQLSWNGRDERGAEVSSGVYLVRAIAVELRLHTRIVLLK